MKTLQLLTGVLVVVVGMTACNRAETSREAREAANEMRTAAAAAGERLADSWLTTKVQAQFFADDDIKGRYITVTTRDGVVTLKGHVESDDVRQQALQIARNTDGVQKIDDQLAIGTPVEGFEPLETAPVATSGRDDTIVRDDVSAAIDDARITMTIHSKYFLDSRVKGRHINVDSKNGIVTLRGNVGSDIERNQALLIARMTEGVQRVEDSLSVDASLAPAETSGTTGIAQPGATAPAEPSTADTAAPDISAEGQLREKLAADVALKASGIDVSVKNGVVLLQGTVPNQAAKQRALTMARDTQGVVQVVDRLSVALRR